MPLPASRAANNHLVRDDWMPVADRELVAFGKFLTDHGFLMLSRSMACRRSITRRPSSGSELIFTSYFPLQLGLATSTRRFLARPSSVSLVATGMVLPKPLKLSRAGGDAMRGQPRHHRFSACLGERLIIRIVADVVGVALYFQLERRRPSAAAPPPAAAWNPIPASGSIC